MIVVVGEVAKDESNNVKATIGQPLVLPLRLAVDEITPSAQ